jgi:hypothetical protein
MGIYSSYGCAVLAAGLLALHFNAELFPTWSEALAWAAALLAVAGALLSAAWLHVKGWNRLSNWPGQLAFATNTLLGMGFLVYAA